MADYELDLLKTIHDFSRDNIHFGEYDKMMYFASCGLLDGFQWISSDDDCSDRQNEILETFSKRCYEMFHELKEMREEFNSFDKKD